MLIDDVRHSLAVPYGTKLVDELLEAYVQAKRNFHAGGLRLAEVEAGRFCEAAFRLLEIDLCASRTPLGTELKTDALILKLQNTPATALVDAIRLHIPRALRLVYDIRNKRDAAHLADNIDPNLQDATLVIGVLDWTVAEFVRLHHGTSADEAQAIVQQLVTRAVPTIEVIRGFPKILRPDLRVGDYVLILLYNVGPKGASISELRAWVRPAMRANLVRSLQRLDEDALIHLDTADLATITARGIREAERRKLLDPK